jgi:hypothetical protein
MTNNNFPRAQNGDLPNEFGVYPNGAGLAALWVSGRNFVEAELLELEDGRYAYSVSYQLKNVGATGPLSANDPAPDLRSAIDAIRKTVGTRIAALAVEQKVIKTVDPLFVWANQLGNMDIWTRPVEIVEVKKTATGFDLVNVNAEINAVATQVREADNRARAVAAQIGYQLPADSTSPDLICRDIQANMRRSVEACLEVGRGLLVLKSACGHGSFMGRLDGLGLDVNVAGRFMRAAGKFSNSPTSANLVKAIGNQSKLFEMMVLDDEEIDELALTGQTGELKLDDVASMSVKELRAAVRKLRGDINVKEAVAKTNQETIQGLQEALEIKQKAQESTDDEQEEVRAAIVAERELHDAIAKACKDITGVLSAIRKVAELVNEGPELDAIKNAAVRRLFGGVRNLAELVEVPLHTGDPDDVDPDAEFDDAVIEAINEFNRNGPGGFSEGNDDVVDVE